MNARHVGFLDDRVTRRSSVDLVSSSVSDHSCSVTRGHQSPVIGHIEAQLQPSGSISGFPSPLESRPHLGCVSCPTQEMRDLLRDSGVMDNVAERVAGEEVAAVEEAPRRMSRCTPCLPHLNEVTAAFTRA